MTKTFRSSYRGVVAKAQAAFSVDREAGCVVLAEGVVGAAPDGSQTPLEFAAVFGLPCRPIAETVASCEKRFSDPLQRMQVFTHLYRCVTEVGYDAGELRTALKAEGGLRRV